MKRYRFFVLSFILFLGIIPATAYSAVQFAMDINKSAVRPNETINAELTVVNDGDTSTGAVTLELIFPENLFDIEAEYISTGGSARTVTIPGETVEAGETIVWNLGSLPPGDGVSVDLISLVPNSAAEGALITFEAAVNVDGVQQAQVSQTATVTADPFFELAVDEATDPVISGDLLEYVLTFSAVSTSALDSRLTFPVPAGTTFVSATGGATEAGGEVTWDLGSLAGGASGEQRVTVRVSAGEGNLIEVDSASISGTDADFITHEVLADRVTRVADNDRPLLSISVGPKPVKPGKLNVELMVTNPGSTTLSNVELIMRHPWESLLTLGSLITSGGSANTVTYGDDLVNLGQSIVWSLGDLPPGHGVSVSMPTTLLVLTADGTLIQFEAAVNADGIQQAQASQTTVVKADPFFALAIDEASDPVIPGDILEYILTYSTISTTSSDTQLRFPVPAGTTFVSATGSAAQADGEITWDLGSLAGGTIGEYRVMVEVTAEAGDLIAVSGARISGTDASFFSHEAMAGRLTRVADDDRPLLAMAVGPKPIGSGQFAEIALTVTNPGTQLMSNVELLLQSNQSLLSLNNSTITTGGEANTVTILSDSMVSWSLGNLPAGGGVSVSLPAWVFATGDGTLAQFDSEVGVDGIQQAHASSTTALKSDPVFQLAVDEATDPIPTTGYLEYVLTYGNISADTTDTQLVFPLPDGTAFVAATGDASESGGTVTWDLGDLDGSAGGERRVLLAVMADEGDVLQVDSARLNGTDSALVSHEVLCDRVTRVEDDERPLLTIDAGVRAAQPGETLDVEVTVTNTSDQLLANVELILRYPEHLNALSQSLITTGGEANTVSIYGTTVETDELIVWSLGNLPAGGETSVTLQPTVSSGSESGNLMHFEAEVRSDGRQKTLASKTVFVGTVYETLPWVIINTATSVSTFADLIIDKNADITEWYRLWTGRLSGSDYIGNFVDTFAFNDYGNGWISKADLASLKPDYAQANDTQLWVQTWDSVNGLSEWMGGYDPSFNNIETVSVTTTVNGATVFSDMFNDENVEIGTWYQIWIGDAAATSGAYANFSGSVSYAGGFEAQGWVQASDLGNVSFDPALYAGDTIWIQTYTPTGGELKNWESWSVSE